MKLFFTILSYFSVQILQKSIFETLILQPPATSLHIVRIANITKPLRILYQIIKLFLILAQAILSAMTLPHLTI